METVFFRLPGHGDMTLRQMNLLRSRQHFCDITIVASNNQTFRGHKVVLAACSPFLRDQFLLNPSSRLQVSMLYSSAVVCDLLQSCYTGILQFNPEEIVNYLTAASYFQMEHIVERCRAALEKYVQLRNSPPPRASDEESQNRGVIVSGSAHSVASPPTAGASPVQHHSPAVFSVEENSNTSAQGSTKHHDDSPLLDEPSLKITASDEEEEARRDDYNVFRVYISEEEQMNKVEGKGDASDVHRDLFYPETDGMVVPEDVSECDLTSAEDLSFGGIRAFTRKLSDPKISRGRGRGRGRGFKKKKWTSEKKSSGLPPHQDLWYPAGLASAFGLDVSQDELKAAGSLFDFSRLDFNMRSTANEKAPPMNHFPVEDSPPGEGGSGLPAVGANEGGDESVAVVGSTSSVTGPVICEHCGLTFPSAHSLAAHSRSTHLLYICPCCGKHFRHNANLSRHMAVHRGTAKAHQCPLCYKNFTQKSTLIDHMNLHSGERPHHCAYCHARFAHKPALRRHLKEQHGKTTGQNSLHELEERERVREAAAQEVDPECLVAEPVS